MPEVADLEKEAVAIQGRIELDHGKPDGMPRKLLDTSKLTALGWQPSIALADGIADTYDWYRENC